MAIGELDQINRVALGTNVTQLLQLRCTERITSKKTIISLPSVVSKSESFIPLEILLDHRLSDLR